MRDNRIPRIPINVCTQWTAGRQTVSQYWQWENLNFIPESNKCYWKFWFLQSMAEIRLDLCWEGEVLDSWEPLSENPYHDKDDCLFPTFFLFPLLSSIQSSTWWCPTTYCIFVYSLYLSHKILNQLTILNVVLRTCLNSIKNPWMWTVCWYKIKNALYVVKKNPFAK